MRAYYSDKVSNFLNTSDNEILGHMLMKHKFSNDQEQKNAWAEQIEILKFSLKNFPEGTIYFEFSIPRMGKRADNILILNGIIYVLEFKVYSKQYDNYAINQVVDYALDLKNFHSRSHDKVIIPILIATEGESPTETIKFDKDGVASCIKANKNNLGAIISKINDKYVREAFNAIDWEKSSYKPTPTIVEAARCLYSSHSVEDISRSDAGAINLTRTTKAIEHIIKDSKQSFRSERLSEFVHNVVENNSNEAMIIFSELENNYPIFLTRDLEEAKFWIKQRARGSERYRMVASSKGLRLRAEGIHLMGELDSSNWFLNAKNDTRSSYILEEAATEFNVQGLELDWTLVCWDANYRRENNSWAHYAFRGTKWQNINKLEDQKYLMNSYRVLLTRARQGMVILCQKVHWQMKPAYRVFMMGFMNT